jgi:prevent-host-death family protein
LLVPLLLENDLYDRLSLLTKLKGGVVQIINVHEAKTQFSRLLARAHTGEEIIIAKAGKPYAKLVPIAPVEKRIPGISSGAVTSKFFDPLPEQELEAWEK